MLRILLHLLFAVILVISFWISTVPVLANNGTEIKYDDGTYELSVGLCCGGKLAVHFSLPYTPAKLKEVSFYSVGSGGSGNIIVHILNWDYSELYTSAESGPWVEEAWNPIDLSTQDITVTGDFFVVLEFPYGYGPNIGVDNPAVSGRSSLIDTAGSWYASEYDYYIRAVIKPVTEADLSITKIASPNPVEPGGTVTYTYYITNNGPDDAQNVQLFDYLPAGLTFDSFSVISGLVSWFYFHPSHLLEIHWGFLAAGANVEANVIFTVNQAGEIINTATVDSDIVDTILWNNSSTFTLTVNDPPIIHSLPDKSLDEDTSLNNTIDLWAYGADTEDPDSALTYSIVVNTNPDCGVRIDSNRYIDIDPATKWNGYSDVTIQVRDTGGLADTDTFRITVNPVVDLLPTISFTPPNLGFTGTEGGFNPPAQMLDIWNSGDGALDWSVSDSSWLNLSPFNGISTGETDAVTVSVDISGMAVGEYDTTITISDPLASNSPQTVPVHLTINPPMPVADEPSAEDGFASIAPFLETAYGYRMGEGTEGWTIYNPLWPSQMNTLKDLFVGRGYWISVSAACTLQYGSQSYDLDAGWNLIGWIPQQ
ncbi:CARDB domain-containing protein [Candidatus Omnitrophota bacterium]